MPYAVLYFYGLWWPTVTSSLHALPEVKWHVHLISLNGASLCQHLVDLVPL